MQCTESKFPRKFSSCIPTSNSTPPKLVEKHWTPRLREIVFFYRNADYIYGPRCQLLTCNKHVKGDISPYMLDPLYRNVIKWFTTKFGVDVDCLAVEQGRVKWRAVVNTVMNMKMGLTLSKSAVLCEDSKRCLW